MPSHPARRPAPATFCAELALTGECRAAADNNETPYNYDDHKMLYHQTGCAPPGPAHLHMHGFKPAKMKLRELHKKKVDSCVQQRAELDDGKDADSKA